MKKYLILVLTILIFTKFNFGQSEIKNTAQRNSGNKITAEEIVSKHLASIGQAESLALIKSRVLIGSGKFNSLVGTGSQFSGVSQFASEGNKVLFAMIFESSDSYRYEKAGFDGKNFTVGLPEGNRTILGDFLKSHNVIFNEGLIGGTLSTAWTLLNLSANKSKVEFAGIEKIDNLEFYKLKYIPKNSGTLKITFYFDKNFRHVMSRYEVISYPKMVSDPTAAIKQKETRFTLVEQFSNFKTIEKLTLPSSYSIDFTIQKDEIIRQNWSMNFLQIINNESLETSAFRVS